MTISYGDDKSILTVVARLRRIGVLASLWINRNRAIRRLRGDGIGQRVTICISAGYTSAHGIILRDGVRVIRRFWWPIDVLVIVIVFDCCIDSPRTDERQCSNRPSRQTCCGGNKSCGSEVLLNLGKVEVRPRTGVLPPPMHSFHIFQDQVTTVALIVLDEEVADGQRAAIFEDNQEVTTDLFEALNRLRTDLDLDDAGLRKRQIPRINNGNFAGRLGDDFRIHAFPRYKTSEKFCADSNHSPCIEPEGKSQAKGSLVSALPLPPSVGSASPKPPFCCNVGIKFETYDQCVQSVATRSLDSSCERRLCGSCSHRHFPRQNRRSVIPAKAPFKNRVVRHVSKGTMSPTAVPAIAKTCSKRHLAECASPAPPSPRELQDRWLVRKTWRCKGNLGMHPEIINLQLITFAHLA